MPPPSIPPLPPPGPAQPARYNPLNDPPPRRSGIGKVLLYLFLTFAVLIAGFVGTAFFAFRARQRVFAQNQNWQQPGQFDPQPGRPFRPAPSQPGFAAPNRNLPRTDAQILAELQNELRHFNPSENERSALVQARRQILDSERFPASAQLQTLHNVNLQLLQLLGPERFAQLQRATDPELQPILDAAKSTGKNPNELIPAWIALREFADQEALAWLDAGAPSALASQYDSKILEKARATLSPELFDSLKARLPELLNLPSSPAPNPNSGPPPPALEFTPGPGE